MTSMSETTDNMPIRYILLRRSLFWLVSYIFTTSDIIPLTATISPIIPAAFILSLAKWMYSYARRESWVLASTSDSSLSAR